MIYIILKQFFFFMHDPVYEVSEQLLDVNLNFGIEGVLHSFCGLLPLVTGYCLCQMQLKKG